MNYFLIGGTLLGAVRHKGYIPWDDDLDIAMPRTDYEKLLNILSNKKGKLLLDCDRTNPKYWLPFAKVRNSKTIYQESLQDNYGGPCGIWVDIFPLDNGNSKKSIIERAQYKLTSVLRTAISLKYGVEVSKMTELKEGAYRLINILPTKFIRKIQYLIMTLNKNDNSEHSINLGSQYGYKKQTHLKAKYYPAKKLVFEGKEYSVPNDWNYVLTNIYGENYMKLPPKNKRITHCPIRIVFEYGEEVDFNEEV